MRVRSELRLRFHHGRVRPWIRVTDGGTVAVAGPDAVWLNADGPVRAGHGEDATVLDLTVPAGRKLTTDDEGHERCAGRSLVMAQPGPLAWGGRCERL